MLSYWYWVGGDMRRRSCAAATAAAVESAARLFKPERFLDFCGRTDFPSRLVRHQRVLKERCRS